MTETENRPRRAQPLDQSEVTRLQQRVIKLEQALVEYVEYYGLTDKARDAFRYPMG